MKYKYIFGPVPSRRLGTSLGIDLMPHKTCSLNCVYCECGRTTHLTLKRKEYIPVDEIVNEIKNYLKDKPKLDNITFSGSGEPTLHSGIGEIIKFLKTDYPDYNVALLTNSTLFDLSDLRKEIINVDIVVASLDAVSDNVFKKINRPHPLLSCSKIIQGLTEFRKIFSNSLWLEVFMIPGLNDFQEELIKFRNTIKVINPDKVQLNTIDRPGTESWVKAMDKDQMQNIAKVLNCLTLKPNLLKSKMRAIDCSDIESLILATIKRRPCTALDIVKTVGLSEKEIEPYLDSLCQKSIIEKKSMERGTFYKFL